MTDLEAIEARQAARERLRPVMSPEWAMANEDIAGLLQEVKRYREALEEVEANQDACALAAHSALHPEDTP